MSALNLAQLQAVHVTDHPCLVLAGAGSGKTRVITHKIAHLIDSGLAPQRIAAITFTNKAAAEMRERTAGLAGRHARQVLICTFHALGVRLLREDGQALGLKPNFSILDTGDVASILKDCAGAATDLATARQWQWAISALKNAGLDARQALAQAQDEQARQTAVLMQRYEERLAAYQSVDFDDLIGLPLRLLREHAGVREKWQRQLGHVLVDEYQDTNATQYELLKLLVGEQARFTAVGDDDQSIYGWRGATLENLKRLPRDFPALKVVKLEQNYRSTSAILRAANHVIAPNPKLFPKTLFSELGEGEPVRVQECDHEEHEAERVVARIQTLHAASNPPPAWKDFAVLYRANHQAKPLEKALRRAGIPYKVSGGTSFFDRAEIRDLCAWFRLWSNNDDDPAFVRAITTPRRGLGHTTLARLGEFASQRKVSLFESLFSPALAAALPQKARDGLAEFGRAVNEQEYRARHTLGAEAARGFLAEWLSEIGYERYLHDAEDSDKVAAARWSNVLEFCDWMAQRAGGQIADAVAAGATAQERSLLDVARNIALLSTISEREQEQDMVTLSTLHAAKGLEWPHVVLVGVTEGMLPFRLEDGGAPETLHTRLEEERRLMYVGITRARRTLVVSWTRRRKKGREMVACQPSRFIAEMQLDSATQREDPREKLRQLRAEFARKAAGAALP
ncbi:ATP-dependent helicase [Comamonas flocculans]|uniref:ATP-dependent DNA helicase Rep n=1 Tax=Comamonas flocculans TaxID=2597701 RepID=A0A5B8RU83_9BURK|nr:UvrD-helicase domain-containing protein [Comamonas flocculans]QEA12653.1 AAA family ATPase [Comamonas flocculans]